MKRIQRLVACIILTFSVFLLPDISQSAQPIRIAAAIYGLKAEFANLYVASLKAHPAVKSGQVQITVFDGKYDPLVQNDQFDTIITQKFDAAVMIPVDFQGSVPGVKKAIEARIPVIVSNATINWDGQTAYIGSDDVIGGELLAEAVCHKLAGKGNVVILQGPIGGSGNIDRTKGIENVLKKYPDVKVLEMKTANWSRAEGLSLMENWLTSHPGQINGIIGENDEMALGAIQALKAAKLPVKDFAIGGIDGVADALTAVKAGEMFSILQDSTSMAQGALDLALRQVIGPSYQPQAPLWKTYEKEMPWKGGTEKVYWVPWTPVTAENVDKLIETRRKEKENKG
jgi:putative xylitol transport system substrate-binding protein